MVIIITTHTHTSDFYSLFFVFSREKQKQMMDINVEFSN